MYKNYAKLLLRRKKYWDFFKKKDRRSLSSSRECSLRKCHPVLSLKNIIPPSYPKGIRNKCFRNIFFLDIWVQFPLPGIVFKSQVGTSTQIPLLLWRAAQAGYFPWTVCTPFGFPWKNQVRRPAYRCLQLPFRFRYAASLWRILPWYEWLGTITSRTSSQGCF